MNHYNNTNTGNELTNVENNTNNTGNNNGGQQLQMLIGMNGGYQTFHNDSMNQMATNCNSGLVIEDNYINNMSTNNSGVIQMSGTVGGGHGTNDTFAIYQYSDIQEQINSYDNIATVDWEKNMNQLNYGGGTGGGGGAVNDSSQIVVQQANLHSQSSENASNILWNQNYQPIGHHINIGNVSTTNAVLISDVNNVVSSTTISLTPELYNNTNVASSNVTMIDHAYNQNNSNVTQSKNVIKADQLQTLQQTPTSVSIVTSVPLTMSSGPTTNTTKKTTKRNQKSDRSGGSKGESGRVTKPVSAYALFFRDSQAAIKSENPSASFGEISKIVASKWEVLGKPEKDVYKERADHEKKNYLQNLASSKAKQVANEIDVVHQQIPSTTVKSNNSDNSNNSNYPSSIEFVNKLGNNDSCQVTNVNTTTAISHQQYSQQQHLSTNAEHQLTSMITNANTNIMMEINSNNNGLLADNSTSGVIGSFDTLGHSLSNDLNFVGEQNHQPSAHNHHHHHHQPQQQHTYHHSHHQSTINPVLSQSSFVCNEQYTNSATGHQHPVHANITTEQLTDPLSVIGDNSFFDPNGGNLIDLGIDLNDFDESMILLNSGDILSPTSGGVFDANDYLNDLNGIEEVDGVPTTNQLTEYSNINIDTAINHSNNYYNHTVNDIPQDSYQMDTNTETDCQTTPPPTTTNETKKSICIRDGCDSISVESTQWDSEFCSENCCVQYCADMFYSWTKHKTTTEQQQQQATDVGSNTITTPTSAINAPIELQSTYVPLL